MSSHSLSYYALSDSSHRSTSVQVQSAWLSKSRLIAGKSRVNLDSIYRILNSPSPNWQSFMRRAHASTRSTRSFSRSTNSQTSRPTFASFIRCSRLVSRQLSMSFSWTTMRNFVGNWKTLSISWLTVCRMQSRCRMRSLLCSAMAICGWTIYFTSMKRETMGMGSQSMWEWWESFSNFFPFSLSDNFYLILHYVQNELGLSFIGSPAIDLTYLIFSSSSADICDIEIDMLLQHYQSHLHENLIKLNYSLPIPSLIHVHNSFLKCGVVGFMYACLLLPMRFHRVPAGLIDDEAHGAVGEEKSRVSQHPELKNRIEFLVKYCERKGIFDWKSLLLENSCFPGNILLNYGETASTDGGFLEIS